MRVTVVDGETGCEMNKMDKENMMVGESTVRARERERKKVRERCTELICDYSGV